MALPLPPAGWTRTTEVVVVGSGAAGLMTALALADAGLAVTSGHWPGDHQWPDLLARALAVGGSPWERWSTDGAAERAARVIEAVARTASCA